MAAHGAAEHAHSHLREEILRGRIVPGTMLSENEIAADLEMSRTPVRAALTRLQDEGWVTIYPKRGALVREFTESELLESAQVRHALESAGVQRSTSEGRARLTESGATILDAQAEALATEDFHGFTELAMRFHRGFVELADNATMLEIYDRLQDRQRIAIMRSVGRITGDASQTLAEHRAMLDDAIRGDWTAFATHLRDHQDRSHGTERALPFTRD